MSTRVYLAFGESSVGKTSWALSGKGRIWYAETDAGSFERASASMANTTDIDVREYYAPLTALTDIGKVSGAGVAHHLHGWDKIWWTFVGDYLKALDGDYETVVIDTSTRLWLMCRNAYFERVQEAKGDERERLSRLEYSEPSAQMSQIVEAARIKRKNLVMLAHEGEVYTADKPTGVMKPDGYKEIPNLADCTMRFSLKDRKPLATIYKAGAGGLELIGKQMVAPTMKTVSELLSSAEAIRRSGMAMPETVDEILATGAVLA